MATIPALLHLSRQTTVRLRKPAYCLYCQVQQRAQNGGKRELWREFSTRESGLRQREEENNMSTDMQDFLGSEEGGLASLEEFEEDSEVQRRETVEGTAEITGGEEGLVEVDGKVLGNTPTDSAAKGSIFAHLSGETSEALDTSEFLTRSQPPTSSRIATQSDDDRFLRSRSTTPIRVDIRKLELMQKRHAFILMKKKIQRNEKELKETTDSLLNFFEPEPQNIGPLVKEMENLKPQDQILPQEEYDEVCKSIQKRFLVRHLKAYLAWAAVNRRDADITARRLKELAKFAKKQELSEAIMENIWHIYVKEKVEKITVEKMKVSQLLVYFLLLDDGKILRTFASYAKAQVKINSQINEVEIKAPIIGVASIKHWLSYVAEHIVSKELDMEWVKNVDVFTDDLLKRVASASNTHITRKGRTFTISALGLQTGNLEGAIRMLISSLDINSNIAQSYMFLIDSSVQASGTVGNIYCIANKEGLNWRDRNEQWGRWRIGLQSTKSLAEGRVRVINEDSGQDLTRTRNIQMVLDQLDMFPVEPLPKGIEGLQTEYTAKLGYLLHKKQYESPEPETFEEFLTKLPAIIAPPPFHTFIPRLDALTLPLKPISSSHLTRIVMRFHADPWSVTNHELYPPIELILLAKDDHTRPEFQSLRVVRENICVDLMSPTERADIRFERRSWVEYEQNESTMEAIEDYLERSTLDMTKQRLVGAVALTIRIPGHLKRDNDLELARNTVDEEVRYLFSTMDLRYEQSFETKTGRAVRRTVVEGGAIGGRRVEVLVTGKPDENKEMFVKDTLDLLEQLT